MITLIKDLPDNIIGFKYEGEITSDDYETVLYPAIEAGLKRSKELRVLCQMAEDLEEIDFGAAWDDTKIGLRYFKDWEKIAFVSDRKWLNRSIVAMGFLMPGHVRTYTNKELDEAIKWLAE